MVKWLNNSIFFHIKKFNSLFDIVKMTLDPKEAIKQFMRKHQLELQKKYHIMNEYAKKNEVVFVGSSLMEHFPLNELAQSSGMYTVMYNRGISGYKVNDIWNAREECIFELQPRKVFINIGTNDIGDHSYVQDKLVEEYRNLLNEIKKRLPEASIYVMAYYPVNAKDDFGLPEEIHKSQFKTRTNDAISKANDAIEKMAGELHLPFINVNNGLVDGEGNLKKELSTDGIHMFPNGYNIILKNLRLYIEE